MIHGTSSIEYGPSVAVSLSIVAAMCFSRMRKSPARVRWSLAGSSSSWRPVEMIVANTGLSPSNATSVCSVRFTSIHFSPGARSFGGGRGSSWCRPSRASTSLRSVSKYVLSSTICFFPVSCTIVKRSTWSCRCIFRRRRSVYFQGCGFVIHAERQVARLAGRADPHPLELDLRVVHEHVLLRGRTSRASSARSSRRRRECSCRARGKTPSPSASR